MRQAARGVAALTRGLERVLTSPFLRARQTAEIVADALGCAVEESPHLALGGDPALALKALGKAEAVLLVGHEPGLSALVGSGSGRIEFRKGALARFDLPPGRLVWLLTSRQLRILGRASR